MSVAPGRQGAIAFFVTFCVCLVALAVALNVGWVVLTLRELVPLLLGSLIFAAIITGLILNTIFLVREIRRNEQHDAFVNSVTHELKTPVTSIRLHLETLKARGAGVDDAKRFEFYDVMLHDSDRLLHLIEQVLSVGQKGRVPLQQERIDLRALATDCITLTRTQRHLAPDALRLIASAGEPVEVMGDPDHLRGAILNLLDNAVKYSRENIQVEVEVGKQEQDLAVIRVRDRGIGIPPNETKRIFGRFYRTPWALTQRVKGTGLGLFIVAQTAKRHGGRAFASSDGVGRGATFTLELPSAPPGRPLSV
ncbi:MAG TPA: HAMP domain-containing sensor histidine kinase [Vicinamibacterales bacterium]|nr:HAMP domain-containing sensor histidine kinase [Vicinamibacterales bacterium]